MCSIPSVFNNPLTTLAASLACYFCSSFSSASSIWPPPKCHLLGTPLPSGCQFSSHWIAYILCHSNQNSKRNTKKNLPKFIKKNKDLWIIMMSIFNKKSKEEYVRHGGVQPTSSFEEELTAQLQGGQLLYSLQLSAASGSTSSPGNSLAQGHILPGLPGHGDWGQVSYKSLAISAWCRTLWWLIVFVPKCFTGLPEALSTCILVQLLSLPNSTSFPSLSRVCICVRFESVCVGRWVGVVWSKSAALYVCFWWIRCLYA